MREENDFISFVLTLPRHPAELVAKKPGISATSSCVYSFSSRPLGVVCRPLPPHHPEDSDRSRVARGARQTRTVGRVGGAQGLWKRQRQLSGRLTLVLTCSHSSPAALPTMSSTIDRSRRFTRELHSRLVHRYPAIFADLNANNPVRPDARPCRADWYAHRADMVPRVGLAVDSRTQQLRSDERRPSSRRRLAEIGRGCVED